MTQIPGATRQQQTRQITIPRFEEINTGMEEIVVRTNTLTPEAELGTEYSPTVGYALELLSIYMPIRYSLVTEGTPEEQKAATFTTLATLKLLRRGLLLWEGTANLISTVLANNVKPYEYRPVFGTFGAVFNNPFIVPSPSELTVEGKIVTYAMNSTSGHAIKWELVLNNLLSLNNEFTQPGSINYSLVKMPGV